MVFDSKHALCASDTFAKLKMENIDIEDLNLQF